jgi:hypothetical protein
LPLNFESILRVIPASLSNSFFECLILWHKGFVLVLEQRNSGSSDSLMSNGCKLATVFLKNYQVLLR